MVHECYVVVLQVSKDLKFEVLRGLTNSLLAAKKPDEVFSYSCELK